MKDYRIVIFTNQGAVIKHCQDPTEFLGRTDVLINPEYPKRVPPHLWALKHGKIVVLSEKQASEQKLLPTPTSKKRPIRLGYYLLGVLSGILLSGLGLYIRMHK